MWGSLQFCFHTFPIFPVKELEKCIILKNSFLFICKSFVLRTSLRVIRLLFYLLLESVICQTVASPPYQHYSQVVVLDVNCAQRREEARTWRSWSCWGEARARGVELPAGVEACCSCFCVLTWSPGWLPWPWGSSWLPHATNSRYSVPHPPPRLFPALWWFPD